MKRWILLFLALIVVAASIMIIHAHLTAAPTPTVAQSHLVRVPNSAFKYHLCTEALAYTRVASDSPYKTDYSFQDPFRHVDDTITPYYLGLDARRDSGSFSVKIILPQVATFNETIANIHGHDGIAILIPDAQNQLQRSPVPQFIITLPGGGASVAILDYTCPEQWVWSTKL